MTLEPHPDLFGLALDRLGVGARGRGRRPWPSDAEAAAALGLAAIGVVTGGFSVNVLRSAACVDVLAAVRDLPPFLRSGSRESRPARQDRGR
jgi:hypothetical protein